MRAEYKAKIENRKRTPLQDVLPLDCPFSIQVDVADVCNMKCNFCFHSDAEAIRRYNVRFGIMKMDVYQKVIDDIQSGWGSDAPIKKLRLFAHGEPLLNKQIIEMIAYARNANVAEIIELTTNGTILNHDFCLKAAKAGLGIINISVNGINAEQYERQCGYKMDWEKFVDGIRDLYNHKEGCRVFIKLSDIGYSEDEKRKFLETFGEICDQIFIEGISSTLWQDTDVESKIPKNDKGIYGQEILRKKVCTTIFTTMVINSFGQAKLCCSDWKNERIVGDTKNKSVNEIWNGKPLNDMRIAFLKGMRDSIPMCKNCESPEITTTDNVDDYMEELLKRIN